MNRACRVQTPLDNNRVADLKAGDEVLISGTVFTARDAAHARLVAMLKNGEELPFAAEGAVIYYVGPCPPRPGAVIGSAGPTTSGRMDPYVPALLEAGVKGMIGKGGRSAAVAESLREHKGVYFVTVGGAGAYLAARIKECSVIAFPDLGAEAVYRLELVEFPAVVAIDSKGNNIFNDLKKTGR